jgi:hypothetical protein
MPNFQLQYDPADIPRFAAEYMAASAAEDRKMEEAGKRVAGGDFSRRCLEAICRWKSARRVGLLDNNTDVEIKQALRQAIAAAGIKQAVCSLTKLAGVGVKMASAILTAIDPARYTVLDFRALEALGQGDSDDVDFYVLYVDACQRMAKGYGVTLRDFDRSNWQWSKLKGEPFTWELRFHGSSFGRYKEDEFDLNAQRLCATQGGVRMGICYVDPATGREVASKFPQPRPARMAALKAEGQALIARFGKK